MLEMCPNCKSNHIAFSNRCAKRTEAAKVAGQSRETGSAGRAAANAATGVASGTNTATLGHRPKGTATGGGAI
jgi:hypothetical protein